MNCSAEQCRNKVKVHSRFKEIKKLLIKRLNCKEIAKSYNVSHSCISDIKRNATWVDVLP